MRWFPLIHGVCAWEKTQTQRGRGDGFCLVMFSMCDHGSRSFLGVYQKERCFFTRRMFPGYDCDRRDLYFSTSNLTNGVIGLMFDI